MKWATPSQLRKQGILGMNSRNVDYIGRSNERRLYPLVDNKLKTKNAAIKMGMSVPKLIGVVEIQHEIQHLERLLDGIKQFVIKPAQGSGGRGILVIKDRQGDDFIKTSGELVSFRDIRRHTSNILSGLYSLGGRVDVAMIEDMIDFDPMLSKYSYEGVPDIRVIIYHGYPVMAMMRCSTHASDGKANLHQGAVGVGIDIVSGCSLYAVQNGNKISQHPDTQHSFDELKLPHWDEILRLAASCYEMTDLGYFGADIVLDEKNGPVILELNARPGLAIQMANQAGLKKRLKTIDSMTLIKQPLNTRIQLAQQLFAAQQR
ncbi:MAG: alpha-L-glutamate ligase-like protein [Cycloclasticus sp.]